MAITKAKFLNKILISSACAFLTFGLISTPSFAQKKSAAKPSSSGKRDTGQNGIVVVDGAAVYESANFDSPVMDYLDRGKSVFISKKVYKGAGGLGAFYKMRVRKGVFGYITDVDVQISGKAAKNAGRGRQRPSAQPPGDEVDPNDPSQLQPDLEDPNPQEVPDTGIGLYLNRYLGPVIAQYTYAEEIGKQTLSGSMMTFGAKLTGPGPVLGGLPLDVELNIATALPTEFSKYYKSSSGFMLLGHAMAILPASESRRYIVYYGLGLTYKYSKFDIVLKKKPDASPIDSQELTVGVAGELGFGYALSSRYILRGDVRYYIETESYPSFGVAFQIKY